MSAVIRFPLQAAHAKRCRQGGADGNLTVADAFYAYAVTGSAFATVMILAAPHLEMFARCVFHGKG